VVVLTCSTLVEEKKETNFFYYYWESRMQILRSSRVRIHWFVRVKQ